MMLFNIDTTLPKIFESVITELEVAADDVKHPFRILVLSSVDDNKPVSRYVVLRSVLDGPSIQIYTDVRSNKIEHLEKNRQMGMLFYNREMGVQVSLNGFASTLDNVEERDRHWDTIKAKKPYNSVLPPGAKVEHPSEGHQWLEPHSSKYFTVLTFIPEQIEVLQLNDDHHLRARFSKFSGEWKGEWLVP